MELFVIRHTEVDNPENLCYGNIEMPLVENYEKKSGQKAACIEEIAYNMDYIDISQLNKIANSMHNSEYGNYLLNLTLK